MPKRDSENTNRLRNTVLRVVPKVRAQSHGDTRSTVIKKPLLTSIGSGGERSSSVTTACTAFDEGANNEALSRRSGKGRVHAGAGVVDSPFFIDRGTFGSEFETNFTADKQCSLCRAPRSAHAKPETTRSNPWRACSGTERQPLESRRPDFAEPRSSRAQHWESQSRQARCVRGRGLRALLSENLLGERKQFGRQTMT
jgi:hypothetical protein